MKMKQLFESILDVDDIDRKSKPWLLTRESFSRKRRAVSKPMDVFGNPLKKGDMVLGTYGSRILIGIIIEMRGSMCLVCFSGNMKDMDKYKTPAGDYRTGTDCGNLLKITPEIAEMILSQK